MKKILLILTIILSLVYTSFAQQSVSLGSSHTYNVTDEGFTYTWATSGGTTTDFTTQTTSQANIIWDTPGDYQLTVFATDANLCITETQTINVSVMAEASVIFALTSGNIITCSDLNSGSSGGLLDKSDFELTISSGVAPYTLKYKVLNADGTEYTAETEMKNLTGTGDIISIDNDFKNNTLVDIDFTLVITELITADGFSVPLGDVSTTTRTITIHAKPVISNIQIN